MNKIYLWMQWWKHFFGSTASLIIIIHCTPSPSPLPQPASRPIIMPATNAKSALIHWKIIIHLVNCQLLPPWPRITSPYHKIGSITLSDPSTLCKNSVTTFIHKSSIIHHRKWPECENSTRSEYLICCCIVLTINRPVTFKSPNTPLIANSDGLASRHSAVFSKILPCSDHRMTNWSSPDPVHTPSIASYLAESYASSSCNAWIYLEHKRYQWA